MSSRMQQWRAVEGVEVEGSLEAWLPGPGPCLAELEEPVGKRKREQFLEEELIQGHLCPTPIHICRRVPGPCHSSPSCHTDQSRLQFPPSGWSPASSPG